MEYNKLKVGDKVTIINTKEEGEIIYADLERDSYLVAKNSNKNNIQFYNVVSLKKIKK